MKRISRGLIIIFALAWLVKEVILPGGAAIIYSSNYMELASQCDTAMEDSWYYRQESVIDTQSETVQLLICHDYDKTRKILLMSGLPEAYLSWLGLRSLELYQRPPEEFVKKHRFLER